MKMLTVAAILAALALPAIAQAASPEATAKVEPQSTATPAKPDAKAGKPKATHAHAKGTHKHKKKPATQSTAGKS